MLLFVLGALVVFHFAVPADVSDETQRVVSFGLLWVAIIFTAILGLTRAFVAEREQRLIDALVLAPCDRSAIWLAKTLAVMAFLLLAELIALPRLRAVLSCCRRTYDRCGPACEHRYRGGRHGPVGRLGCE